MENVVAKKRIMIVDDEVSFARMVKLNLEKTGQFEVRTENKPTCALASAREFKPDLIFLDVVMPSMDGGDVSSQLRRDRQLKDVPIVFLTATVSRRETGDAGLASGGDLFIAKPVTVEALIQCIHDRVRKDPPADASSGPPAASPPASPPPASPPPHP